MDLETGGAITSRSASGILPPLGGEGGGWSSRFATRPPSLTLPAEGREQEGNSGTYCVPVPYLSLDSFTEGLAAPLSLLLAVRSTDLAAACASLFFTDLVLAVGLLD